MKLEICIDSVESALAAEVAGADRVELCQGLIEGGTTPSPGTIRLARKHTNLGLMVIIRPRGGDFLYTDHEMDVMLEDIREAKAAGADGVVIGCLNADGTVDVEKNRTLILAAQPMSVTFHRAFDVTRDPFEALETIVDLGCDRILTSGQEASVLEGADLIRELIAKAGDRIVIMPGGGITTRNVGKIAALTGAQEIHMSCRRSLDSGMQFRNSRVYMGGALYPPEFARKIADTDGIRNVLRQLGR